MGPGHETGAAYRESLRLQRFWAGLLLSVVVVQLVTSVGQFRGVLTPRTDINTAALVGNRASGTFNHPDALGKALFFLLCLVLQLMQSSDTRVRRMSRMATVAAFVPLVLTGSRADALAGTVLVCLWGASEHNVRSFAKRLALPSVAVLGGLVFLILFISRIKSDPAGGERDHFMRVALAILPEHSVAGVGPNSYVTAAGPDRPPDGSWLAGP